jgi:undecaprenyl diphosphate synthase
MTDNPQSSAGPRHIAIVMDGNGRWASQRGRPRTAGHHAGAKSVRAVVEHAVELNVEVMTLFAFSSENWQRPPTEVQVLMDLFLRTIRRELAELRKNGVRLKFIGNRDNLSGNLRSSMAQAEELTAGNSRLELVVAVDYGGRWDIFNAARRLALDCAEGRLDVQQLTEADYASRLSLASHPAPDLFIRTGSEKRVSNFLLWDLAYSELYFTDVLWPDFDAACLQAAVEWYAGRNRRFGRVHASG